jgi:streptomycin 6-kinase
LKVPFPGTEEVDAIDALLAFGSHGGVAVLRHDVETGAVLMPQLRPGTDLARSELTDQQQTEVCASLILQLRAVSTGVPLRLETWFRDLDTAYGDPMIDEARIIAARLFATSPSPVPLHGDLHHFNILRHGEEWVVIDPKGVMGDPAYEVAAFMRNPVDAPPNTETLSDRIKHFHELLGDPVDRLWGWSFVQTTLSALWSDGEFSQAWKKAAQNLRDLKGLFYE